MLSKTEGAVVHDHAENMEFVRPSYSFVNNCSKFLISERTFDRQYASLYISRLKLTSRYLVEQARKKWGPNVPIKPLCDVTGDEHVVVIGTIFKHMELHPSILKEISEEHNLPIQPVSEEFAKEDDFLILEDDLQRVILCGSINPHSHVTGVNIAIYGYTEEGGKFFVEDYCYPLLREAPNLPLFADTRQKYVLLVSGFGFCEPSALFPLHILKDLITGLLGDVDDQKKYSHVVRVIIAGNSIGQISKDFFSKANIRTRKSKAETVQSVKALDKFLSELVPSVDIDLMPGEHDPANHLMPQQPLHPCMFPECVMYSSFHVVTNPYEAVIDGVRFLGSSGQNIKDICSFSKLTDPLDVMEKTLDWGHLSPTSPDTLNTYPYSDDDPFIINEHPHVYFAGNMPKMGFRYYGKNKQTLMISIPKFTDTFTAVLLNLRTLEVEPLAFCQHVIH